MNIRYGKPLNSLELKKGLNKGASIDHMKNFSTLCNSKREPSEICPICESHKSSNLGVIYDFTYRECSSCQTAFIADVPISSDIEKLYTSELYTNHIRQIYGNPDTTTYRIKKVVTPKVEHIIKRSSNEKKTWLDIGCGTGEILYVASDRGFKATGLEANEFEREFGIKNFGVNIINDYIDEESIKNYQENYGIISLFGVLEHLVDPHKIVNNISHMQSKNDNLVIEVPHHPSVSTYSQLTFPEHVNRMAIPPFHLILYSTDGLSVLLNKYGYDVTDAWYFGQDFYEYFSTLCLFNENLLESPLAESLSSIQDDIQLAIDKNQLSDQILVIARRR